MLKKHISQLLQRVVNNDIRREFICNLNTSSKAFSEEIRIPIYIPRTSTDILEALSSTLKRDFTGPHYKYHDDPFLTPASNLNKRTFSLSKESGRKAARYIRDKHGKYFTNTEDDPKIEAFIPQIDFNPEDKDAVVNEEMLMDLMEKKLVNDAIVVSRIMKERGIELSEAVCQQLLEFVSFYNCEETLSEDWVEERWYQQSSLRHARVKKTWKDAGLAEELFASLENPGSEAYCALIKGMATFYQVDRAWKLYEEACEKQILLDTGTYNSLIRIASSMRESAPLQFNLIKEVLENMVNSGVHPNLGTLNSVLEFFHLNGGWRQSKNLSLQVLAEFKQLGIEPSLASYYYLLTFHCRERGPTSHILLDILSHIEHKQFDIEHPKDTFFFVTAMDVAANHLKSFEVAERVDQMLHNGTNYKLRGDNVKDSIYKGGCYSKICFILKRGFTAEKPPKMIQKSDPYDFSISSDILYAVKIQDALQYLPVLWSNMVLFGHSNREKLVALVLETTKQHQLTQDNTTLTKQITTLVWDAWTRVQAAAQDDYIRNKIQWTSSMVGDILTVLSVHGEYYKAVEVMNIAVTDSNSILGYLPMSALKAFTDIAIENKEANTAMSAVVYAVETGHQDSQELARKVVKHLELHQNHRSKLTTLFGADILESDS
ncbi:unnamed protein product, partial [Meganyctiphanes norvegica]